MNTEQQNASDLYYVSKEGFRVFTEKYHLLRGYCCTNNCRHCPYGFDPKTHKINLNKKTK